ncbi:MAG: hypothetical protein LBL07_13590, partial [Tannerella sp.]|nr:hypothetical protein [Tannerella sp.]
MNKKIMLLICAIVSISGYSQEKASTTQNPDGNLHVQAIDFVYFDVSGKTLSMEQFNDSLKTGRYILTIDTDTPTAKTHLVNKYPPKTEIIGKKVPLLIYNDISGQSREIGRSSNISVLSFWSITCAPCIRDL